MNHSQKIAIIGGGLAGLSAAYSLKKSGYNNFELFEAKERLGGRVFSVKIKDGDKEYIGELGGQNIYDGDSSEHIEKLVEELGLTITKVPFEVSNQFYDPATKQKHDISALVKKFTNTLNGQELGPYIESIASTCNNLDEVLLNMFPDKGILYRSLVFKYSGYEGGHPKNVSAKAWDNLYYMLKGGLAHAHPESATEMASIKGGNAKLIEAMSAEFSDHIHTASALTSITKIPEGLKLNFGEQEVIANKVILAIPLPVIGDISIDQNVIPSDRLELFGNIRYGANAKILHPLSEALDSVFSDNFAAFTCIEPMLLNLYFAGEAGENLVENSHPYYASSLQCLSEGEKKISQANDQAQLREHDGAIYHSWWHDKYAKGSYSYRSVEGYEETQEIVNIQGLDIRKPFIPIDSHIFFAGEHCATIADIGTMEGAVESGLKAAELVLANIEINPECL